MPGTLKRYRGEKGVVQVVKRGECGLKRLSMDLIMFGEGRDYTEKTRDCEVCVVLLSGKCDVEAGDRGWKAAGKRDEVFKGPATAIYVPRESEFRLAAAHGPFEAVVCRAAADADSEPALISPDKVDVHKRGKLNWTRYVHTIMGPSSPSSNMMLGETYTPPGNWSAYPPHRHDLDNPPHESDNEEIYFFRSKPENGFQIIRIYNDSGSDDESFCCGENDAVAITGGYHPTATAPGYRGYYLWLLSGDKKEMHVHKDPSHVWVEE